MKTSKRKSLTRLFGHAEILDEDSPDRASLFADVFGQPHSAEKDYLLRNEFRLLTDRLTEFIAEQEHAAFLYEQAGHADHMLLKGLLKRGLHSEYESQFKKLYERALQRLDFQSAHDMSNQHFNYVMTHKEIRPESVRKALHLLEDNADNSKLHHRTELAINLQGQAALKAMLRTFGHATETASAPEPESTPYIRYFEAVALAHGSEGHARVDHAHEAVAQIGTLQHLFPKHMLDGLALLAGAYFGLRMYEEAAEHYLHVVGFAETERLPLRHDVLYNYCSTLMKLRRHEEVIQLMADHKTIFTNARVRFKFECFLAMVHIFMNNPEKARATLSADIGHRPEMENNYFRFIFCILPYLCNDVEEGLRETENFIAYFNYHKGKLDFFHEKEVAQAYRLFYLGLALADKEDRKDRMRKVTEALDRFTGNHPQYIDFQYVAWLYEHAQKVMEA
ncbi:MAG: hypothetical protein K9J06_01670 [Flavobacteriales bacterium]|nr:hypothetical protein [Flavobacteriales bacterium]